MRFIADLCAINDHNDFSKSFKDIHPPASDLKVEHQGLHATFLDLDISIVEGRFVYKLYDKHDKFPFHRLNATFGKQYSFQYILWINPFRVL